MPSPDSLRGLAQQIEEIGRNHPEWSRVHNIVLTLTGYLAALARVSEFAQAEGLHHQVIEFDYVNWRGEAARRQVKPMTVRWGTSDWYKEPQWLLSCWDLERKDVREFALANMTNVKQQDRPSTSRSQVWTSNDNWYW